MPSNNNPSVNPPKKQTTSPLSPVRILMVIVVVAFAAEALIMSLLPCMLDLSAATLIWVDSSLLVILVSPVFYLLLFRPLVSLIDECKKTEEELRRSEQELAIRNQIARIFLTSPEEDMYTEVLQVVLGAMESKYGLFGYIDQNDVLVCPSMTKDIWEKCNVADKKTVFPRETWGGIWGQALNEKKSVLSTGSFHVPEGHIPITNTLAVPIIHQDKVIGIFNVANKPTDYDEHNQALLEAIADYTAPILNARLQRDLEEQERKQAQEAFLFEKQRLDNISQYANCGLLLLDEESKVTYANKLAEEWFGPLNEIESKFCWELFKLKNPEQECAGLEVLRTGKTVRSDTFTETLHGEKKFFYVVASPIKDSEGKVHQVTEIVMDITERKQAEEALKARQKEIEELNDNLENRVQEELKKSRQKDIIMMHQARLAAMGEMIGLIAHQWRQPLNAINLLLYNIKDMFAQNELNEKTLDNLTTHGMDLVDNMSTTIDDFRNFFQPNKKKETFNINQIIKNTLSLLDASFKHHNISVVLNEKDDITFLGFANEYSQVVLNILNNARDAIIARKIKGKITIDIFREMECAAVKIQDNGGGIPEAILEVLFDPYFTTKTEGKGTGLGLHLAKVIIEEHMNGYIAVNNIDGGAEFKISTPISP